jgi:muramidase (phage lysozyme)
MTILEATLLDTIAYFEGTIGRSANGYDILLGGKVMNGWEVNTTIVHRCVFSSSAGCIDKTWYNESKNSTAAGRYQFVGKTWGSVSKKLKNVDNAPMTKSNQDEFGLYLAKGRGVKSNDLENGLKSLTGFKSLLKKMENEWESFKRSLNNNYSTTPDMGWEFYKGAYQKYKDRGTTGTQVDQNTEAFDEDGLGNLIYLNQQGKKINKFGTQKISSNGDKTKFYVNIPSGSPDKIIYFWSGLESVISRKSQWDQIPGNIKSSCYIVMAAGVTNQNQNSLNDLKNVIKNYNSSIKTNKLKEYIMGYSAGGYSVFNNYDKKYKFVALIDPSLSSVSNTENRKYSKNVAMIWGSNGMMGISNWATRYPKVDNKIKDDGGFSQKINKLNHSKAIQIWFSKYGNKIVAGQTTQEDQNDQNQSSLKPKPAVGCSSSNVIIGLNNSGNLSGAKNVIVGSSSVGVLGKIPSSSGQYGGFYSNKIYAYYNCAGKTLPWLRTQIKNDTNTYTNVKRFFQVGIGTNDGFPTNSNQKSQIKQYTDSIKERFPNATLYVFPGTYGWGNVSNKTEQQVLSYYKQYEDEGWVLLRPKDSSGKFISSNLPQGNHDPNNPWFQGQMKLLKQYKA